MRCRYLVPTLGLMAFAGSASAVDIAAGVTLDGYVDTWFEIRDQDVDDADTILDFNAEAHTDISWMIGDSVSAEFHAYYNGDGANLETGTVTWAINDQVSVVMGQYINVLGWEAAHAPDRYRFDRSILVNNGALNFYGAATNQGVGVIFAASEELTAQVYLQDDVFVGDKSLKASDDVAVILDVAYSIEDFGGVNGELVWDGGNAPAFGGEAEEDVIQFGLNATYTGTEKLIVGAEFYYHDYDLAGGMGAMVLANYMFLDNASASVWFAYGDPVDDDDVAEDDEIIEFGVAVLTNPTDDANFALNFEIKVIEADDENPTTVSEVVGVIEMLAIIP